MPLFYHNRPMMSGGFRTCRRRRRRDREKERRRDREKERRRVSLKISLSVPPSLFLSVFLPARQPQPLQRVGSRITGRGNLFLRLETAHGFDGGLIVYAGQFAGVKAALLERLLNLERA